MNIETENMIHFGIVTGVLGFLVGILCTAMVFNYALTSDKEIFEDKLKTVCRDFRKHHRICAEFYRKEID